jgi:hypothetical protein
MGTAARWTRNLRRNLWHDLWRALGSTRLAAVLLAAVLLASALASLLPQMPADRAVHAPWLAAAELRYRHLTPLLRALGLFDAYHAPWFLALLSALLLNTLVCPPYTALWPVAQALRDSRIQLGGQNIAPSADLARTGEVSAALLADVGCRWVMLGHWEVRRHLGDDDGAVNRKVHLALDAGLAPILLLGEARAEELPLSDALERQLPRLLDGCQPEQVKTMALVYEPEGAIGGIAGATQWRGTCASSTAAASRPSTPPTCCPVPI